MNTHGFVQVAALSPGLSLAQVQENVERISVALHEARSQGVQLAVFPELCLTGATCGDLFATDSLLQAAEDGLFRLLELTRDCALPAVVGLPLRAQGRCLNVAALLCGGEILGLVPKTCLTHAEQRFFVPATVLKTESLALRGRSYPCSHRLLFRADLSGAPGQSPLCFGIALGEDACGPLPQHARLALAGAELICHPAAFPARIGSQALWRDTFAVQSRSCGLAWLHANAGDYESTTDQVFDGSVFIAEAGTLLAQSPARACSQVDLQALRHARRQDPAFAAIPPEEPYWEVALALPPAPERLSRRVEPAPFVPASADLGAQFEEALRIQTTALAARLVRSYSPRAVVGVSGGLDSTLALLVTALAFDRLGRSRQDILGVTLPGFGTTGRTYQNAVDLIRKLGLTFKEISIREACIQHFKDIQHPADLHNVVYENTQARERTQMLMDLANQHNALVVGTGDLSELALGWATYNGDHMSMYGVNAGLPKTLIRPLVAYLAENHFAREAGAVLQDIVDTPISPELLPADAQGRIAQKTEDLVGPYELHDFFLWHLMVHGAGPAKIFYLATHAFAGVYAPEVIRRWLQTFFRRFFAQQFKRSCLPDGPQVCAASLSPRGGWQMPSDASAGLWLKELETV